MNPLTFEAEPFEISQHEQIEKQCDCPKCRAARESEGDVFENNGNPIPNSWRNWGRGGGATPELETIEDFEESEEEIPKLDLTSEIGSATFDTEAGGYSEGIEDFETGPFAWDLETDEGVYAGGEEVEAILSGAMPPVKVFAEKLAATWWSRRNGSPSSAAIRDWLLKDHQDTLQGAARRYGKKFSGETITRAWMISREEQMRFQTASSPGVKPLRNFAPPSASVALVSSSLIADTATAPVAPVMVRFVEQLRQRYRKFSVWNYPNHGGGKFNGRGYSLDFGLQGRDARGFYPPDQAITFLRAVRDAAKAVNAQWRVLYNDFTVADTLNRETGVRHVGFMGTVRRNQNKAVAGINWHGPHPLILHFHLDLAPITGAHGTHVNTRSPKREETDDTASSSRAAELEVINPLASKLNALRNWTKLLLLKVKENIRASLSERRMRVQYAHNESYSNDLNIDLYPVRINKFPTNRGKVMTPAMMLKHIRTNINSLVDTSISSFHPYSTSVDAPRWASDDPTGAVLKIRIRPDNAAVVVSSATPTGWTFTTVETPDTGTHPVSGHRTFFIGNRAGVYYFINKGLDMTSSGVAGLGLPFAGEYGYGRADKLWISLQNRLVEFINKNGGDARKEKRYSQRIEWRFVFYRYNAALERVFGKGAGSPDKSQFLDIVN